MFLCPRMRKLISLCKAVTQNLPLVWEEEHGAKGAGQQFLPAHLSLRHSSGFLSTSFFQLSKGVVNMADKNKFIGLDDLQMLKDAERERFALIDSAFLENRYFLKACRVKILMLVDLSISYSHSYFGLSTVLDTLRLNPEWWVKFDVTRAHRQIDLYKPPAADPAFALYGPHHENFDFINTPGFNIDDYDEVWFYGFESGYDTNPPAPNMPPPALRDDELNLLFKWMDKGGGVLAMGDHADLGQALCSKIPRARNMRKWKFGAVDDPLNPPQSYGLDRHDTNRIGYDDAATAADESAQFSFDDESDDIPQTTRLRWYYHHHCGKNYAYPHWHWPYFWNRSPHPVLCGTKGPINILPDHPHEGEVIMPTVLTDTLSYGAYSAREYPDYSGSPRAPEIIAWGRVLDGHTNTSDVSKGAANAVEFGVIGAYNGHCVNVGRVVVDSTWHHWFDVNLTGRTSFSGSQDPRKHNGFNDTPAGQAALARIKNYFRNVAIWLAPTDKLKCMASRALWGSLFRFPLAADIDLRTPIWIVGNHAINALGNYAGQCNVRLWWPLFIKKFPFQELIDPNRLKAPPESLKMLDEFMIGGILHTLLAAKKEKFTLGKVPEDKELMALCEKGVQAGMKALLQHMDDVGQSNLHMLSVLKSGGKDRQ